MTTDGQNTSTQQLSPEALSNLTVFANVVAWKQPNLDVLRAEFSGKYSPLVETMQTQIKKSHSRGKLVLPDLRAFNNETVAVFTDYGGESKEAKYFTYSTLVCGWNLTRWFLDTMNAVRQTHGLGDKEIAFKDFGMGQVQRSLPGYLNALDKLPGFLFTLAIDKRLRSLFGQGGKETREFIAQTLKSAGLGERKQHVNEKLCRACRWLADADTWQTPAERFDAMERERGTGQARSLVQH